MACFGIRSNCQSVHSSQSRLTRVTRHFCIIKRSISGFFWKKSHKILFFVDAHPFIIPRSTTLSNNTMVTTTPGDSSDCQDGGSTGEVEEEEEEVPMREEEMDVIGMERKQMIVDTSRYRCCCHCRYRFCRCCCCCCYTVSDV